MNGMASVTIIGRVSRPAVFKNIGPKRLVKFQVTAAQRTGSIVLECEWSGERAEMMRPHLSAGVGVAVVGTLRAFSWRSAGVDRQGMAVDVNHATVLPRAAHNEQTSEEKQ